MDLNINVDCYPPTNIIQFLRGDNNDNFLK